MKNNLLPKSPRKFTQNSGKLFRPNPLSILLAFVLFCTLMNPMMATARQAASTAITGKVTDDLGDGIPGVTIVEKGTDNGTVTDIDGNYEINVRNNSSVLVFSFMGMRQIERRVGEQSTINVEMQGDEQSLEEVVVIGYGSQKKSDLTGAVSSVSSTSLQERPVTNVEQALAGRAPGVNVSTNSGRPGGNTNIRIRGNNSVNASNSPLYVVDGVIGAGPINYLNPNDIASMEVLKDASATAIYGARGANGVIIVTTKRGSKDGGQVNYSSFYSMGEIANKIDVLNSEQFLQVEQNAYNNSQKFDPDGWAAGRYEDPMNYRDNLDLFDANGNPLYNTDWQDEATRRAFSQNHSLSFTGGDEDTSYGLFMNYADEQGIVLESYLKRYSGRFVMDGKVKDWLDVGGSLTFNHIEENRVDGSVGGLSPLRMMIETLPIIPVQYADGTYGSNIDYPNMEGGENPVNLLRNRQNIHNTQTVLGDVHSAIKFNDNLQLRSNIGININNFKESWYSGKDLRQLSADYNGEAWVRDTRTNYWQFENYLNYEKELNENHAISGLLGISWQQFDYFTSRAGTRGFTDDFYLYNNLGLGSDPLTPESDRYKWAMNSYFGRFNYNLMSKYLFTFTGRVDGSSKFGSGNKYAFFPSAAFAWRVADEGFMQDVTAISDLKLRSSYGVTGNSEIGVYQSLASMGNSTAIIGGQRAPGVGLGTLPNPNLRWEKTAQFDIGLEFGMFNNRVMLEADYYYKKTSDMLLSAPVPTSSGFASIYTNIGSIENQGIELSINTVNIETRDFTWTTTFNISTNRNRVLALGAANDDIFPGPFFLSNTNILRVGEPVGSFYGLVREGTWGSDQADEAAVYGMLPGDVKYRDVNGDGQINNSDREILGNGIPKGFGALFNTFQYKNFDLTIDIQYSYGNEILNLAKHAAEDRTGQANSFATVLEGWTPENQETMVAQNRPSRSYFQSNIDSRMVEDGSFIRGRNLLLGYNFSQDKLERLHIRNLRVYASVQNFFLLTEYTGFDPEVSTYGDAFAQGITFYDYPKPITYTLGINVSF
ncbi:TonB-dependent receptor [Belliella sp. DSM 111904]|uniref:TonB-dependent receptor n=1 Tax=Belliella filtrata TaxID=2923435 RepID=A0ABS9V2K0_9BACT|nr:TonB-dependent receptor [Belliella filtrata]MCH7410430.1 TonB-dependent receptor [Belliella filtrata]